MSKASDVKTYALQVVGANYQLGNEPWYNEGWEPSPEPLASDCSGLVYGVFRKAGVKVNGKALPRLTAHDYYKMTTRLSYPGPFRCGDVGFLLDSSGHAYHTFLVVDAQGTVVEAGYGGKVRKTTVAVENKRSGIRWGRWNTDIEQEDLIHMDMTKAELEKLIDERVAEKIDVIWSDDVKKAQDHLVRLKLLAKARDARKAASVGYVDLQNSRVLKLLGKP